MRAWLALGLLTGCVRTLQLDETDAVDEPVLDRICVPDRAAGFRVPSQRWALAAAHASHRLRDDPDRPFVLSPSWFLATGWQTTQFACADYGAPWPAGDADDPAGCLDLRQGTDFNELRVLFPEIYDDPDAYGDGTFAGDAPEQQSMALAFSIVGAHALWGREDLKLVPSVWYDSAQDPLAVERVSALQHMEGPWSSRVADVLAWCSDDVEACLEGPQATRVSGVIDKMSSLDAADCVTEPLDEATVRAHVRSLGALWNETRVDEAEQAALDALDGSGFDREAPAVIAAIDAHFDTRLLCPEPALWQVYRFSCP